MQDAALGIRPNLTPEEERSDLNARITAQRLKLNEVVAKIRMDLAQEPHIPSRAVTSYGDLPVKLETWIGLDSLVLSPSLQPGRSLQPGDYLEAGWQQAVLAALWEVGRDPRDVTSDTIEGGQLAGGQRAAAWWLRNNRARIAALKPEILAAVWLTF